jgi:hypothetical protein
VPPADPDTGLVPVGPTWTVEELLNGNGTLAMLVGEPPMPVDLERPPDGPEAQDGDVPVAPAPDVEFEAGNGTTEVLAEGDGTPVGDVTPVPGAVPEGHDTPPVELPTEKGGPVTEAVPDAEPPPVPVPVIDAVPLVKGKGVEEAGEVPVREPEPGGPTVPDSKPDVLESAEDADPVPEVDLIVPGAVPVLVPGPAPPCADVVEGVPVTEPGVVFTGIVGVTNTVVVRWTVLVMLKIDVLTVTVPLIM